MNRFLNQMMRQLINRLTNRGINSGIDYMSRRGSGGKATPQNRQQAKVTRDAVKRARQAARITRRIGR
ncbi:hypothetical protein [Paracoccus tegillarcae]|uniref:Uncharacterized protein n=1 Tax=Paracoccus tegillarcae TaxID=1529068 RepID=A0A2K9EFU3_9RHOB|nr:hypothetical protein [Paracoccus tegillarcae]AUH32197.1 hypothetical protein CUV01_01190 [Paracoccus tegillarcae]